MVADPKPGFLQTRDSRKPETRVWKKGAGFAFPSQYHYQCLVDWSVPVFGRLVSTRLWYRLGRLISEVISVSSGTRLNPVHCLLRVLSMSDICAIL